MTASLPIPNDREEIFAPRTPSIIGREQLVSAIEHAIADESGRSYVLYFVGPGGIGKTRLLEEMVVIQKQWARAPFRQTGIIDLYHADYHSPGRLRQAIVDGLDPDGHYFQEYRALREKYERKRRESVTSHELEELRRQLDALFQQEYTVLAKEQRLVLCFDTVELIQYESDIVQEICRVQDIHTVIKDWLLEQVGHFPNTVTLFAGRPRPEIQTDLEQKFTHTRHVFTLFELGAFTQEETQIYLDSMCDQCAELREVLSPQLQEWIFYITQGRPIYLTLLIDFLLHGQLLSEIFPVARTEQEMQAYLNVVLAQSPELGKRLIPEVRNWIFQISQDQPIYRTLLVDLLLRDESLYRNFSEIVASSQDKDSVLVGQRLKATFRTALDKLVGQQLTEHLLNLPDPFGEIIHFLMHARKGLDAGLLRYLVGNSWSEDQIHESLKQARTFAFVKARPGAVPGATRLFLHDEVYDLCDRYFRADPRFGPEYESIAQYYRQRLEAAHSLDEREELMVMLLYYELQSDARIGYERCYARWDEDAIKNHTIGLDMRLRDEVLRFLERYVRQDSPFYAPRTASRIDQTAIDRSNAVRWIKRYLARGDFEKARRVAEDLRHSKAPIFDWDTVNDSLYKADLLAAWGEALVFTSAPEEKVRPLFEEVVQLLEDGQQWNADQHWWMVRILSRAHIQLGYLYRTRGRYGLALQEYKRALPYFKDADIPDEWATALNNMAFLLALMGQGNQALLYVERALSIREQIGHKYPIALSHNTRGIIYTLQDHPMWGERECREALRICEDLDDPRGIGLACNGLGFVLRKRGDQWKLKVYSMEEARAFFQEAGHYFRRAIDIFSKQIQEPIRLWEAYNELGSLYCDWGWLTRCQGNYQMTLEQYVQSITSQNQALVVASAHDLEFPSGDSYDDLAQVYGDRSFLLAQIGKLEEARDDRDIAESYLDQIVAMVPSAFHLELGVGFQEAWEPGESYWLSLGKVHLQRGVWLFRQIEHNNLDGAERDTSLSDGIRHFALAVAYFQRYSQQSFAFESMLRTFASHVVEASVPRELAHKIVQQVASKYAINLDPLLEIIDSVLGT